MTEKWQIHHQESFKAKVDLSGKQNLLMKVSADEEVDTAGAGDKCVGVLMNKPAAAGRGAEVMTAGVAMLIAGATVAIGDYIKSDAAGKGIKTTTAGDEVVGRAESAANASEQFKLRILPFRY